MTAFLIGLALGVFAGVVLAFFFAAVSNDLDEMLEGLGESER